ncbi:MAG TPA: glycosyltransferase [Candidatus Sulfotelmatobacter sp.]|jgi:dolichol-phosphate mannosyltransferase|nr:glycosyltransferase [Candidatus Sulfotelmatobacter sp.]
MLRDVSKKTFALVIPTLNEAGNIDRILTQVTRTLSSTEYDYEIAIVDDGSTDGTVEKVRDWSGQDKRIRLLSRQNQRGLAGAVLYGWSQTQADLIGVIDADLQHPPELLPELLKLAESADIAIASRYAHRNGTAGWNPLRVAVSRVSNFAAMCLTSRRKVRVTDPMSGFFILHRDCIEGVTFQTTGFKLLLEILVRGRIRVVREAPYHFGVRKAGKSKASAAIAFHYLHLLSRLSRDMVGHSSET